jgi:class 3 adenylate cyclase
VPWVPQWPRWLQQEIDRANRRGATETMRVRVGISTGDVTFEGGDCFGLPVVEAQRLEASAEPGTIRCSEMVKLLARGREYVHSANSQVSLCRSRRARFSGRHSTKRRPPMARLVCHPSPRTLVDSVLRAGRGVRATRQSERRRDADTIG